MNQSSSKTQPSRKSFSRFFSLIALLFIFLAGFIVGSNYQKSLQEVDLSKFWSVYHLIQDKYVGSVSKEAAAEGAVKGLVETLDDPYSTYLPPQEKQELDEELKGEFEGIGAVLVPKDDFTEVSEVITGSPAEKAGLKAKDLIITVDGESIEGIVVDDVVRKIRGPKGTQVTLSIVREGAPEPLEIKITRDTITIKSVEKRVIGSVGYIEVNQFGDDTVDAFSAAVREMAEKKVKALIVDMRNNPGGYLNAVPPMVGQFISPSVIVKQQYKSGKTEDLRSVTLPLMPNTPLYVLINKNSASAAEIFAGALQDYGRAKLIGEKSYGKGSVQDLISLPGNSALRLTIAEWLTPKGRKINKVGIEPDIKVEGEKTTEKDPVLDKALELAAV